jgi:hypothetical protein
MAGRQRGIAGRQRKGDQARTREEQYRAGKQAGHALQGGSQGREVQSREVGSAGQRKQAGTHGRESRQGRRGLQADMQAARHGISGSEAGRQSGRAE